MQDISVKQLKQRLDAGEDIDIIDVREDWETQIGMIPGAVQIRMDDIPDSMDKISQDKPVVIMCHTGVRSEQTVLWLESEGYENLLNLVGGIAAWSREIDPSLPTY